LSRDMKSATVIPIMKASHGRKLAMDLANAKSAEPQSHRHQSEGHDQPGDGHARPAVAGMNEIRPQCARDVMNSHAPRAYRWH
jgi:hypothetical protein